LEPESRYSGNPGDASQRYPFQQQLVDQIFLLV
jgi:hypothetical protein